MASRSTRSSGRRSEGLVTNKNSHNIATATTTTTTTTSTTPSRLHHVTINNSTHNIAKQEANTSRKKRPRHEDILVSQPELKKARYAVEIESKPFVLAASKPKARSLIINNAPSNHPLHKATVQPQPQPQPPQQPQQLPPAPQTTTTTPHPHTLEGSPKPTIHNQKVANGIKHELDRLQPAPVDTNKDEKRKLRSQEGARFKSELSLYFPEYDEVIGNDPKEDHILNHDTPIIIIDSSKSPSKPQPPPPARNAHVKKTIGYGLKKYPDALFDTLNEAQRIDFSFLDSHCKDKGGENPLQDLYYETVHKKPERHEKSIRNTDKGRAQHEKNQVIRLLEGLQGHDWLKLMGVSGITDSRKKEFEPARDHFIRGCLVIIEKFKTWRDEEKRRRIEKEQAMAAVEEEDEEAEGAGDGNVSDGDPPDYSDVDVSAARQLHEEAIARSAPVATSRRPRQKVEELPVPVHPVEKDFKSFFSKPYLREAALHKHRRSGRSVAAWGQPVPELTEHDFDLPEEYRDEETLRVHARRKRRDRRISRE